MTNQTSIPEIYFDGSCKPNPGRMGIAIMIDHNGKQEAVDIRNIGHGTNNIAEWSALLLAVQFAHKRGFTEVAFKGDSNLIIQQALGNWKVNGDEFVALRGEFQKLTKGLKFTLSHVPREINKAGIWIDQHF